MLVIRDKQMEHFQQDAEADFVDRVIRHLREYQSPELYDLEEDELRRRVEYGIEKARGYYLTWEKPITLFVRLMFTFSPNFDKQPNIRKFLTDIYEEDNEKMDFVVEYATDEDWDEASRQPREWSK